MKQRSQTMRTRFGTLRVKTSAAALAFALATPALFAAPNAVTDLAPVTWAGQGLFLIDYTVRDVPAGRARSPSAPQTFRTHYLHGEPPFKWSDYSEWMKK